jgi:hypothetical protein
MTDDRNGPPLSAEARAMLAGFETDGPPAGAEERVWARVEADIGVAPPPTEPLGGSPSPPAAASAGTAAGTATSVKIAVLAVATAFSGAAVTTLLLRDPPPRGPAEPAAGVVRPATPESVPPGQVATPPTADPAPVDPARVTAPTDTLEAERRTLARAQRALSDARIDDALEHLRAHAHRWPAGQLAETRDALRVRALVGAGRLDEARGAARHFRHSWPDSLLTGSLDVPDAGR